ncbi:MAG: glycosyltransferase family 39 protein [Candidatus Omnitrophica bacterium]|nr:glycosyltransferase family 39 protein [Candidatus Omnitrophota bacterium]
MNNVAWPQSLFKDIFALVLLAAVYFFLAVPSINWDHVELRKGYGTDPDKGGISEALGYAYHFKENWSVGYKTYPQGYGLGLALFYKTAVFIAQSFHRLPDFALTVANNVYGRMPSADVKISTIEGRTFFLFLARWYSVLWGYLTLVLVYMIGRDHYGRRSIGLASAFFLMASYSFMMLAQLAKYPAMANFFVFLNLYYIYVVLRYPGWRTYILAGICAGLGSAVIYYHAIFIFFLGLAHILALPAAERRSFRKLFFHPYMIGAGMAFLLTFGALNPRIIKWGFALLLDLIGWSSIFGGTGGRGDVLIYHRYHGLFSLLGNLRDHIGPALSAAVLAGLVAAVAWRKEKMILLTLLIGLFYSWFSLAAPETYIIFLSFPVFYLVFSRALVQKMDRFLGNTVPVVGRRVLLALIVAVISAGGFLRIYAQGLINTQISSPLLARMWIQRNLPQEAILLTEAYGVMANDHSDQIFRISFQGGKNDLSHNLCDMTWDAGEKIFNAQYAVAGGRFYSETFSEENVNRYPAFKKQLSPRGIGYGLRESYQTYRNLLQQNAVLVKEFPQGKWIGEDQLNILGYQFLGVPLAQLPAFLTDPRARSYGYGVKIYRLTPEFWAAFEKAAGASITRQSAANQDLRDFPPQGFKTEMRVDPLRRDIQVNVCWQNNQERILRQLFFCLEHCNRQNKSHAYFIDRIKDVLRQESNQASWTFNEMDFPRRESYCSTYRLAIPPGLKKGKYTLKMTNTAAGDQVYKIGKIILDGQIIVRDCQAR